MAAVFPDSNSVRRLLFSQYFFNGIQVASGVVGIGLGMYHLFGMQIALAASIGALFVSIADIPSPPRHKFFEMLAALVFSSVVTLLMGLAHGFTVPTIIVVACAGFFSGLLNVYGRKALPASVSVLFAMVIALGIPPAPAVQVLYKLAWSVAGGMIYMSYALMVSLLLASRTKKQALAECLFALAGYLRRKAAFYESGSDLTAAYSALADQQAVVVEKLQAARDFVFRNIRTARDAELARTLLGTLDVYESVFSSHTDYALLQAQFDGEDLMVFLRDLSRKGGDDLDGLARYILWKRPAKPANYKAELFAISHEIGRLRADPDTPPAKAQALEVLQGVHERVQASVNQITALHRIPKGPVGPGELLAAVDLKPFLTPLSFSPRVMFDQIRDLSPGFRFAVRVSLALMSGFALARFLPYSTHSYWILLTIGVVMRSNYSLTKQRRTDRITGTVLGCLLMALVLHFQPPDWGELVILFLSLTVTQTFATLKYRYAAMGACVTALLQIHLMNPGAPFAIAERLGDTVVGALLAFGWTFVMPRWESAGIPGLVTGLVTANQRYLRSVLSPGAADYDYRVARKQLFDAVALLSSAFRRMLVEPKVHQRAVPELNEFIATTYVFAAQVASVRILFQRRAEELDLAAARAALQRSADRVLILLSEAGSVFAKSAPNLGQPGHAVPGGPLVERDSPGEGGGEFLNRAHWTADMLLRRRLASLEESALEVRRLARAIARYW